MSEHLTSPRDYSAMFRDGFCVVCHLELSPEGCDPTLDDMFGALHVSTHLADGTAVVEKAFGKPDRVVPTSSLPVKDTADDPTPKLKKLPKHAKPFYGKSFR